MSVTRRLISSAAILTFVLLFPVAASAQWYLAGYIGGSHTQNATVKIRVPAVPLALDFHDVRFISESLQPRRYYGLRLGHLGGSDRRLGFEIELIHMKAIADTSRDYDVTVGSGTSLPPGGATPMDLVVQEYRMTHGLNFALFNVVVRRPFGASGSGPVSLMLRAGAGPTFPHAETTVNGGVVHHYEYAGPAAQGAAGVEIRLPYRASVLAEYKLTYVRPEIDVTGGTSTTSSLSHHITVGFGLALTRR